MDLKMRRRKLFHCFVIISLALFVTLVKSQSDITADPNDWSLIESIEEEEARHPFEKECPYAYFKCNNGECIAHKWRCDGHYDCDDFSDELNCTALELPNTYIAPPKPNMTLLPPPPPLQAQMHTIEFNSSVEPLMIFSTGTSIRGFWMRSRIYFDIVTRNKAHSVSSTQPSITEAFSLFFGLFNQDDHFGGGGSSSVSARHPSGQTDDAPPKRRTTIVGLDMDPNNKEVFWVELGKEPGVYSAPIEDNIFEARHRREAPRFTKVVDFGLLAPEDIALDNVGKNAYITDAGLPAVVVCSYVYGHCKIIVQTNIHKPRAIIADPATGWVTFTDWGDRPGVYVVSMDGRRFEPLIESDVVWPNGLAADPSTNSLFWADARLNKIERVDLKTKQRFIVIKEVSTNPFSVSLFENRIYWSDWSKNEIKTCNKITGNDTQVVIHADDIYGIHIYHPDLHKDEPANPCWSKRCSHMCLLSPGSSSYAARTTGSLKGTCACPEHMALSHLDKATCYRHGPAHQPRPPKTPTAAPTPQPPPPIAAAAAPVVVAPLQTSTPLATQSHHQDDKVSPEQAGQPSTGLAAVQTSSMFKAADSSYPSSANAAAERTAHPTQFTSNEPTGSEPHVHNTFPSSTSTSTSSSSSSSSATYHEQATSAEVVAEHQPESNKMVWLIVFLLILSATGLVTVLSLLLLHRQGRLPRSVSVSFISPNRNQDRDKAMLLLDTDS